MKRVTRALLMAGAAVAAYLWVKKAGAGRRRGETSFGIRGLREMPQRETSEPEMPEGETSELRPERRSISEREAPEPRPERRSISDPDALAADSEDSVALDIDRLAELKSASYQSLSDYLMAIRIKRGSDESLLFVRRRDVEELATLVGATEQEFLENFRQLGVVVSLN